jgi:hypothetical protein
MRAETLDRAKRIVATLGDDQTLDDIIPAIHGYGPLMHHSGDQLAAMLVRHVVRMDGELHVLERKYNTACQYIEDLEEADLSG